MAVEERQRRQLQEALVGQIGEGAADTLLHYLPPVGWADVATKQDLHALRTVLHAEIGELRSEMQSEVGALRGEIGGLRADLHRELKVHLYWTMSLFAVLMAGFVAAMQFV